MTTTVSPNAPSASVRLRELQEVAKREAEAEIVAIAARMEALAAEAQGLAGLELFSKARRESLVRVSNFLAAEADVLNPPKPSSVTRMDVAA